MGTLKYDDTVNICKVATVDYETQQFITSHAQVAPLSIGDFEIHVFIKGTHLVVWYAKHLPSSGKKHIA